MVAVNYRSGHHGHIDQHGISTTALTASRRVAGGHAAPGGSHVHIRHRSGPIRTRAASCDEGVRSSPTRRGEPSAGGAAEGGEEHDEGAEEH